MRAPFTLFSILFCSLFSMSAFSQVADCDTINLSDFSGQCNMRNKDGIIIELRSYQAGEPSGLWKKLNKEGDVIGAQFYKNGADSMIVNEVPKNDSGEVKTVYASFPGGMKALKQFLVANKQYPPEAKSNCIHGTIYMSFMVDTVGDISEIKVERGVDSLTLDAEAIRLIEAMPKWVPGTEDEQKIPNKIRLPISFRLPDCKD